MTIVCWQAITVASVTGPAAAEGRSRSGDKLVAIYLPRPDAANRDGGEAAGQPPYSKTATRGVASARFCVVDADLARVRQLLQGKNGEPVVLEFLRAAEVCPSDEALVSASYGRPRNTFTVRIVRSPIVDYKGVERSSTVGLKRIEDHIAERRLKVEIERIERERASVLEAQQERHHLRLVAKNARKAQLVQHAEMVRKEREAEVQHAFDAEVAKKREKVDARQNLAQAQANALLAILRSPTLDSSADTACLYLNDMRLAAPPQHVRSMTALTMLHLSNNRIVALPAWIGELTNLVTLAVGNNQICELPTDMCLQTSLRHLDVRSNPPFKTPPQLLIHECPASDCPGYINPAILLEWLRLCHGSSDNDEEESGDEDEDAPTAAKTASDPVDGTTRAAGQSKRNRRDWGLHKSCSVALVGDAAVGKTALLRFLRHPEASAVDKHVSRPYVPTCGVRMAHWLPYAWLKPQVFARVTHFVCYVRVPCVHV